MAILLTVVLANIKYAKFVKSTRDTNKD